MLNQWQRFLRPSHESSAPVTLDGAYQIRPKSPLIRSLISTRQDFPYFVVSKGRWLRNRKRRNIKISLSTVLFVISLLPLLAYPAVLIANVMQVAALADRSLRAKGERPFSWRRIAMGAFIGGTTAYPGVVLACRFWSHATSQDQGHELVWSAAPLAFLATLAGLLYMVSRAE
jgi:hypothetical protein